MSTPVESALENKSQESSQNKMAHFDATQYQTGAPSKEKSSPGMEKILPAYHDPIREGTTDLAKSNTFDDKSESNTKRSDVEEVYRWHADLPSDQSKTVDKTVLTDQQRADLQTADEMSKALHAGKLDALKSLVADMSTDKLKRVSAMLDARIENPRDQFNPNATNEGFETQVDKDGRFILYDKSLQLGVAISKDGQKVEVIEKGKDGQFAPGSTNRQAEPVFKQLVALLPQDKYLSHIDDWSPHFRLGNEPDFQITTPIDLKVSPRFPAKYPDHITFPNDQTFPAKYPVFHIRYPYVVNTGPDTSETYDRFL
jgi:hypothetical protein